MRLPRKLSIIYFIILAFVRPVSSQPLVSPPGVAAQNQVFVSVGLEPELVTTIGYTRLVTQFGKDLDFHMGASLKFAPLIISDESFRINVTGAMDWEMGNQWKTRFSPDLYLAHDNNRAGVMNGLGIELHSTTLHFGEKWTKGFELGWQYTGLTHISHSIETKDTFGDRYPEGTRGLKGPKDGWYKATASRFRVGVVAAKQLDDHWGIQVGIGSLLSIQKQGILLGFSHAQVPVYLESTVSYRY